MTEEEKAILLDIKNLHDKLLKEAFEKEPSAYNYMRNAEVLREKVHELYNIFKPDYLQKNELYAIAYTCNNEVKSVVVCFENSLKRNAARKRYKEFLGAIDKANKQINLDCYLLFKKIEKIK